jgi:hypothetical protein
MSVPRDRPDSPRPMGIRLVVDFTTGRIVGAERPAPPTPPVGPGGRDDAPPTLEAA